ncbi:MAG: hypothetical protein ACI88H_000134 [Cocleimonas sp.]|jgi:hypothetical protein
MLIKPIVEQLVQQQYFADVRASKDIPSLDDLKSKTSSIILPICYLLPVKDLGHKMSADNRPRQAITSTYSFCIIAPAGDFHTIDEPPMTQAKTKLLDALMGFSISALYSPMSFVSGQIQDSNTQYESWVLGFEAERTFRKI